MASGWTADSVLALQFCLFSAAWSRRVFPGAAALRRTCECEDEGDAVDADAREEGGNEPGAWDGIREACQHAEALVAQEPRALPLELRLQRREQARGRNALTCAQPPRPENRYAAQSKRELQCLQLRCAAFIPGGSRAENELTRRTAGTPLKLW